MSLGNWPDPANQQAVINLFPAAAIRPAAPDSPTSINVEAVLVLYKRLWNDYHVDFSNYRAAVEELGVRKAEIGQLEQTLQPLKERISEFQAHIATLQQTNKLLMDQQGNKAPTQPPPVPLSRQGESSGTLIGNSSTVTTRLEIIAVEKALKDHRPQIFFGQMDQQRVMDFLDAVEHFVEMGAGEGSTTDNRCIDVVLRYTGKMVHEWLKSSWALRYQK